MTGTRYTGMSASQMAALPRLKRGQKVGKTKRGKGTKWMVLVDGSGTPLGAYLDSASPSEVRLLGHTLEAIAVRGTNRAGRPRKRPKRLIADRGYDSNPLRKVLKRCGIESIIPARVNNKRATDQDGRKMRRHKIWWIVERTFAWLGQFRRLIVRHERLIETYSGFFHIACALLTLKRVLKSLLVPSS
ncbi:MAG TPA: IS5 family transposase [Thermodesulfobacteriota bacterium]|nr:IS5 family transposase [Thermodesulfobacteriota bacterium]